MAADEELSSEMHSGERKVARGGEARVSAPHIPSGATPAASSGNCGQKDAAVRSTPVAEAAQRINRRALQA